MIVEVAVFQHPDGSRTIGQPDPRHGVKLGRIALAPLQRNSTAKPQKTAKNRRESTLPELGSGSYEKPQKTVVSAPPGAKFESTPCECLSCQTGRPDYPCLIEDDQ